MIDYIANLFIFLAALIAIRGGTWDNSRRGLRKLTRSGWLTAILAVFGLGVSMTVTLQSHLQQGMQISNSQQMLLNARRANSVADSLRGELSRTANASEATTTEIIALKNKLQKYGSVLGKIRSESQRQPQKVLAEFVQFTYPRVWNAPNLIYPGSTIKLYGFTSDLTLRYGQHEERIPADKGGAHPVEVAVIGTGGLGMRWSLENQSHDLNQGKVFVESTPRIRSSDWSWIEEKIQEAGVP